MLNKSWSLKTTYVSQDSSLFLGSDESGKSLASSVLAFSRCLKKIHPPPTNPTLNNHLFNLPCKLMLLQDLLSYGSLCNVDYFVKAAKHYKCSVQKICIEWGKAHLEIISEFKHCRDLALAMLLYKYPRTIEQLFSGTKDRETVIVYLLQQDVAWARISVVPEWNLAIAFLKAALQHNLITSGTFERLRDAQSSEQGSSGMVTAMQSAERMLDEVGYYLL